ncbi:MAG: hypothetical protein ACK5WZ_01510 [Pseudobdellovibrionaceae bacterium]
MTQGKIEKNWNGNDRELDVNSEEVKKFFDNQIVPMWASTKIAAQMLGISPNALRIRKCRGEIECRYFGKHLRFNVMHLQSHFRETREE